MGKDFTNKRILYMGTPSLSAYILEGLINHGYQIIGVVAQEDKPVGRKGIIEKVPTKVVAEKYGIPCYQVKKIREDYQWVKDLNVDLIMTCAYGQIVPQGLLDIPPMGCLNMHGSLLPKYRGASPIQQALKNGDAYTGVTLMEMIDKMDAGRMYLKKEIKIDEFETTTSLTNKMQEKGLELLLEGLPKYFAGELEGIEQDETQVSFCNKISKEEEHLDINKSNIELQHMIQALADSPAGYFLLNDAILKVYKAQAIENNSDKLPGTIIQADKQGFVVKAGQGALKLLEVQKQGKKRLGYKDFINGEKELCSKILN